MSEKRDPAAPPFFHQTGEPHTLRSIEVADEIAPDTEHLASPVYVEPSPLVSPSDHKTLEIQTVKLADDIDPRKLPTELRLVRPPSVPPDSAWPLSEAGLVATRPPVDERQRWRTRALVALLLALLLLGSALALRARSGASTASAEPSASVVAAAPVVVTAAPPAPATAELAPTIPEPAPTVTAETAPSGVATAPSAEPRPSKRHTPPAARKNAAAQTATELAPTNASKPKRAIY